MILLFNLYESANRTTYNRLHLSQPDRIDVWKYTLASLAVIPWWSKICIYCKFDPIYNHRREEIETYIHFLFPKIPIEFYFRRNHYQKEWQIALEPLFDEKDPLIWYNGSDDHPFMDYNLDCISEIHDLMLRDEPSTCMVSSWPELLRNATKCSHEMKNISLKIKRVEPASCQIIHKDIMKQWFWNKNYGDIEIYRTDDLHVDLNGIMYVPLREMCRHFDGYAHIPSDINAAPPLDIPPGFFENDIKITYCSPSKQPGTVHINPLLKTHFAVDGCGADYHWTFDDIPLFWKNKITEFKIIEVFDESEIIKSRNESYARKALMWHQSVNTPGTIDPPIEWIIKSFR